MKKNTVKIILDIMMALFLVLLYNAHLFGVLFHEVIGLFLGFLFVVHCLLNRKWISGVTTKFFAAAIPLKTRIKYVVDILLVVSFLFIIYSGIRISNVLFVTGDMNNGFWKGVHIFAAFFALCLVGIHVGMHWSFVSNMFKKRIRLRENIRKPAAYLFLVLVIGFGVYSMVNVNEHLGQVFMKLSGDSSFMEGMEGHQNIGEVHGKGSSIDNEALMKEYGQLKENDIGGVFDIINTFATYLSILGVFAAAAFYFEKAVFIVRKSRVDKRVMLE